MSFTSFLILPSFVDGITILRNDRLFSSEHQHDEERLEILVSLNVMFKRVSLELFNIVKIIRKKLFLF